IRQPCRPDSRYGVELVDGAEAAVLFPVVEDLLRRHGADSRERVELFERRAVQMDGPARGRSAGAAGGGDPCASTPGNDDLLPVRNSSGEIDELQLRLGRQT